MPIKTQTPSGMGIPGNFKGPAAIGTALAAPSVLNAARIAAALLDVQRMNADALRRPRIANAPRIAPARPSSGNSVRPMSAAAAQARLDRTVNRGPMSCAQAQVRVDRVIARTLARLRQDPQQQRVLAARAWLNRLGLPVVTV